VLSCPPRRGRRRKAPRTTFGRAGAPADLARPAGSAAAGGRALAGRGQPLAGPGAA